MDFDEAAKLCKTSNDANDHEGQVKFRFSVEGTKI